MRKLSTANHLSVAIILTALCLSATLSCNPPRECAPFYELSAQEREDKVRSATPQEQLDLYFCGMHQYPQEDYADLIASGGDKIVPVLLERLQIEREDHNREHIIHIFEEMAKRGHLRGRHDVVEQVEHAISLMRFEESIRPSQRMLRVIRDNL